MIYTRPSLRDIFDLSVHRISLSTAFDDGGQLVLEGRTRRDIQIIQEDPRGVEMHVLLGVWHDNGPTEFGCCANCEKMNNEHERWIDL